MTGLYIPKVGYTTETFISTRWRRLPSAKPHRCGTAVPGAGHLEDRCHQWPGPRRRAGSYVTVVGASIVHVVAASSAEMAARASRCRRVERWSRANPRHTCCVYVGDFWLPNPTGFLGSVLLEGGSSNRSPPAPATRVGSATTPSSGLSRPSATRRLWSATREEFDKHGAEPCGWLQVIDLCDGPHAHWLRSRGRSSNSTMSSCPLGVRRLIVLGFQTEEIAETPGRGFAGKLYAMSVHTLVSRQSQPSACLSKCSKTGSPGRDPSFSGIARPRQTRHLDLTCLATSPPTKCPAQACVVRAR